MTAVTTPRPALGSGMELIASALTVPYAAGMRLDTVPLADGRIDVSGPRRAPVLLARLRRALADEAVVVVPTADDVPLAPAVFAPFSAAGTMLLLFRPPLAPDGDGTGAFGVSVAVHQVSGPGRDEAHPPVGGALGAAAAESLVEGVVLEGRFGRLLYLTTLEKQRCIRHVREIAATRYLELAGRAALDERGLSLGVPRRQDPRESDAAYRGRLEIYSRRRLPTPQGFAEALNGPGPDDAPNAGLPARAGVRHRFRIVEATNELSVATKLVAVGEDGVEQRSRFQRLLQEVYLVDLERVTAAGLPTARRERYEEIRRFLRTELTRPAGTGRPRRFSPLVATTLDRAVRLARALGHGDPIRLLAAHDPAGGSRYELGLGVDLGRFTEAELARMAERVAEVAARGGELGALAAGLEPRRPDDDPSGRWLLEPCGFRTVHVLDDERVHLSPLPTQGQFIEGPDELRANETAQYEARYRAPGVDTGVHVRAAEAAAAAAEVFEARGLGRVPPALPPSDLRAGLESVAAAGGDAPPLLDAAVAAGVVTGDGAVIADAILRVFNLDQIVAFTATEADLAALGEGDAVRDRLVAWADAFGEAGFYSVKGMWDTAGSRLLWLSSVSQLPGASVRTEEPPPATFYWYAAPLLAPRPSTSRLLLPPGRGEDPLRLVQSRGGRSTVAAGRSGLGLLVSIGYARRGLADPFEVRIELDDGALLDRDQYGYLMNLLDFLHPVGIEINTFDIRRSHVDMDGDGQPEFLTSRASRTYHRDRHRRPFGSGQGREARGATP